MYSYTQNKECWYSNIFKISKECDTNLIQHVVDLKATRIGFAHVVQLILHELNWIQIIKFSMAAHHKEGMCKSVWQIKDKNP